MKKELRTWYGNGNGQRMGEDPRWTETRFLVEATDHERFAEWCFNASTSPWSYDRPHDRVEWTQTSPGYSCRAGSLAAKPVQVHLQWDYLDGELVCFWAATSLVVDYAMIDAWLEKKFPNVKRKTNAMNLHNVLIDIREERNERLR